MKTGVEVRTPRPTGETWRLACRQPFVGGHARGRMDSEDAADANATRATDGEGAGPDAGTDGDGDGEAASPVPPETVNLGRALDGIDEHWSPRLAAELNGQAVKVAVVEGEFVEHAHPGADELFYVLDGDLTLEFPDRPDARLESGDLTVVPSGVEHRPVAHEETRLVLFEPAETRNTGDRETAETVTDVERVD